MLIIVNCIVSCFSTCQTGALRRLAEHGTAPRFIKARWYTETWWIIFGMVLYGFVRFYMTLNDFIWLALYIRTLFFKLGFAFNFCKYICIYLHIYNHLHSFAFARLRCPFCILQSLGTRYLCAWPPPVLVTAVGANKHYNMPEDTWKAHPIPPLFCSCPFGDFWRTFLKRCHELSWYVLIWSMSILIWGSSPVQMARHQWKQSAW